MLQNDGNLSSLNAEEGSKNRVCSGPNEDNIIAIDKAGDLLIQIHGQPGESTFYYQVSSTVLQEASPYFDRLLDPTKFSEGVTFRIQLNRLKASYPDIKMAPVAALPVVKLSDVGQIPVRYPSKSVVTHFFDILHRTNSSWVMTGTIANHIALLAIMADKFDVTKRVLDHIVDQGWTYAYKEAKENKKDGNQSYLRSKETLWRQRIFAGFILGVQDWVMNYTRLLVDAGSERWRMTSDAELSVDDEAPWWYLPRGLEGEIIALFQSEFAALNWGRGTGIPPRIYSCNY